MPRNLTGPWTLIKGHRLSPVLCYYVKQLHAWVWDPLLLYFPSTQLFFPADYSAVGSTCPLDNYCHSSDVNVIVYITTSNDFNEIPLLLSWSTEYLILKTVQGESKMFFIRALSVRCMRWCETDPKFLECYPELCSLFVDIYIGLCSSSMLQWFYSFYWAHFWQNLHIRQTMKPCKVLYACSVHVI